MSHSQVYLALQNAGLSGKEIEIYQSIKDKGAVTKGEIAILNHISPEETQKIIDTLEGKNLLKVIPGKVDHYQALPPYAALTAQLTQFAAMIEDLRKEAPVDLKRVLTGGKANDKGISNLLEFVQEMHEMKQRLSLELIDQQRSLNQILERLKDQQKTVTKIKTLRNRSIAILDNYFDTIVNEFNNLKTKLRTNLEKLQLGIIVETVEQMIEKSIDAHVISVKDDMKQNFERRLTRVLEETINEVMQIPSNAEDMEKQIRGAFASVIKKFDNTLESTQKALSSISSNVSESYEGLKQNYSTKITQTLDDILERIQTRINMETSVLNSFWQEAMMGTNYSMQDVWFVRSPAGMQAQIYETLQRTKMKALIVLPRLHDIDVDMLMKLPNHLNIRICAAINQQDPTHREIMRKLDEKVNITYRERDVQNLWGIHKDYEEIILGIVNNPAAYLEDNEKIYGIETNTLEVAAVGSVLEEHIKIFVPILEDAWIGAHKELSKGFKVKTPTKVQPLKKAREIAVKTAKKAGISAGISSKNTPPLVHASSNPLDKPIKKTVIKSEKIEKTPLKGIEVKFQTPVEESKEKKPQNLSPIKSSKEDIKKVKTPILKKVSPPKKGKTAGMKRPHLVKPSERIKQLNLQQEKSEEIKREISKEKSDFKAQSESATFVRAKSASEFQDIVEKIDFIIDNLKDSDALALKSQLESLIQMYEGKTKFSRLITEITNWSKDLQHQGELDTFRKKVITKRLENWRKITLD